ncbi:MAG: carbamoyltransferase HypF [Halobacteriota archaeon]
MGSEARGFRRAKILVKGIVQGVGFRPFVYKHAKELHLTGYVKNLGAQVEIEAEGFQSDIDRFITLLRNGPPISRIDDVRVQWLRPHGYTEFNIAPSGHGEFGFTSPDIAICDECLIDLRTSARYKNYWATSCVNCGPRFTVTERLPYDRETTSMIDFPMCPACEKEYRSPHDRRHHAQTIACERCGPTLVLLDKHLKRTDDPIGAAGRALLNGHIIAIKGIGGFHLSCIFDSAHQLKERLGRFTQPLAIMAPNLQWVERNLGLSEGERALLKSNKRPVTVLDKQQEGSYQEVSNLHNIGVMLPYSGLHYLLFEIVDQPLIMTSANAPGEPMIISVDDALASLRDKADFFLIHDRRIVNRCDDSVVRVLDTPAFIRMSRGYAPISIAVPVHYDKNILALGAEMNATVTTYKEGRCYISQHVGNINKPTTFDYLRASVHNLITMSGVDVSIIAHDYHPTLRSTFLAAELGETYPVQHHQAHIASLVGEGAPETLIGIAIDGIGYGLDGTIWGGEVFSSTLSRIGSLMPVSMPGGDLATTYPVRMIAGMLYDVYEEARLIATLISLGLDELQASILLQQIERRVNAPLTSSTGRVLDAIAAALGVCQKRTYDGEPAMRLEALAHYGHPSVPLPIEITSYEGRPVLETRRILDGVLTAKQRGEAAKDIAASAQNTIAEGIALIAAQAAEATGVKAVGLSGGVAYNKAIVKKVQSVCALFDLEFFTNTAVPRGDGGISFGQAVLTAMVKSHQYDLALPS